MNSYAVIYNAATGAIVAITRAHDGVVPKTPAGCEVFFACGMPSAEDCYVKNGELALYPARPSPDHYWDGSSWVLDQAKLERRIRVQRDRLLAESDWTDTASAQGRLGSPLYYRWQEYRQALRDITKQPGFPLDIVWPTPP